MTQHRVRSLQAEFEREVAGWPGVQVGPHRFGGVEFRLTRGELGHLHPNGLLDIPLPRRVRDAAIAAGLAGPHHILPDSGWVSLKLRTPDDLQAGLTLLRQSLERRTANDPAPEPDPPPDPAQPERHHDLSEDELDEALEESFPASDPPALDPVD